MTDDLLASARWSCAPSAPDSVVVGDLGSAELEWLAAEVPGTAAGAVRARDGADAAQQRDYDATDWWFRATFDATSDGPWILRAEGIATDAHVWLNGEPILHSVNMFRSYSIDIANLVRTNELVIYCRAVSPRVADRRPRARWRTRLVSQQGIRWWRTSLLGRIRWPGYSVVVGPWRPITLTPRSAVELTGDRVQTRVEDGRGFVDVDLYVDSRDHQTAELHIAGMIAPLQIEREDAACRILGKVEVPDVQLWWPHSHGAQPLYDVAISVDGHIRPLGRVGFRTMVAHRSDGGFSLEVNGQRVFMRGTCWVSPDVTSLNPTDESIADALMRLRIAGLNMVRLTGTSAYESESFWNLCDQLGIMVWQDAMLATLDPPDDDDFLRELRAELSDVFTGLRGRPSLAVLCGGSETEQQATFMGLGPEARRHRVLDEVIPRLASDALPGVPYVTSSPSGGVLPTHVGTGVAHYFGVGGYQRPLSDVRAAGVRFASECLALSNPPEASFVDLHFGSAAAAGHHPQWKRGVARDAGASWDFEDVRDHYVREIFGLTAADLRREDPAWALDVGRATAAALATHLFTEWRRPQSMCAGGLILTGRDVVPGAGWGIIDSDGQPKSIWYALAQVCAPQTILACDEGLDGFWLHAINDGEAVLSGRIEVDVFGVNGRLLISESVPLVVTAHDAESVSVDSVVGGFRDLGNVFRFGAPTYDCLRARWIVGNDRVVSESTILTLGQKRPRVNDVGLTALATPAAHESWTLSIATRELAQWVAVDVAGFHPTTSWFHLAPGASRDITLIPLGSAEDPTGSVRALNSAVAVEISR